MILDLFAGAGGAGIGLRRVFPDELIVHVDHDADCCATLRAAFAGRDHRHDYVVHAAVGTSHLNIASQNVTGLWASPPCQPYSHAGKRLGADDERDAWPETLAVIEATRPQWVVIENVRGSPAETWRSAIARLGYLTKLWDLDAADYGVPQHRRRRFVAGRLDHTHYLGPPTPTHCRYPIAIWGSLPWVTIGDALPHLRSEGARVVGGGQNPHYPGEERRERDLTDEPSTTIAGPNGNQTPHVVYPIGNGRAGSEPERLDRPAPTVTAQEVKGTRASRSSGWTFHGGPDRASDGAFLATGRRRLTTAEVARLQDFPVMQCYKCYHSLGGGHAPTATASAAEELPRLRGPTRSKALGERSDGGPDELRSTALLRPGVCPPTHPEADQVGPRELQAGEDPSAGGEGQRALRAVRGHVEDRRPSQGRGHGQQLFGEPGEPLPVLSYEAPQGQGGAPVCGDRVSLALEGRGARPVQQALPPLEKVGGSDDREDEPVFTCWSCGRLTNRLYSWPFQGTKTSIYRQIGNACPPALTEAVVRALLRRTT